MGNTVRGITVFKVQRPINLLNHLFLPDDTIYIENYDPVGGKMQRVYTADRQLKGAISSDRYWDLTKGKYISEVK